jgi:hypothetical protein
LSTWFSKLTSICVISGAACTLYTFFDWDIFQLLSIKLHIQVLFHSLTRQKPALWLSVECDSFFPYPLQFFICAYFVIFHLIYIRIKQDMTRLDVDYCTMTIVVLVVSAYTCL